MDLDLKRKLLVREAMSSPAVTVLDDKSVIEASEIMKDNKIGAIIVINKEGNPIGILTERDLVYRVLATGLTPQEVQVGEVMSSPLHTITPEVALEEALSLMNKINIRRLGVVYKDRLEGIISDKDIIRIIPTIIEITRERARIQSGDVSFGPALVGYCSRCDMYSSNLRLIDGEILCEDCRVEENL